MIWKRGLPSYRASISLVIRCCVSVGLLAFYAVANAAISEQQRDAFTALYQQELGNVEPCKGSRENEFKVCSSLLRNEGNAPYILQAEAPKAVAVLFHGLSDSPFFMKSIAQFLQSNQYTVIVPLTPGHGKKEADADMQDSNLQSRWYEHVEQIMQIAAASELPVFVGGFSTGGAFATWYALSNPDAIQGVLLFSGALELSSSAENMSRIWGIKPLAKWLDGEYVTEGPNPFKYPKVASYSGLVLMDVIYDIRERLETGDFSFPIFAAHSMSDQTTLFSGIESLTQQVDGAHTIFKIDESYELCHADLPLNSIQIINMEFKRSQVDQREMCAVPAANPLHRQMLNTMLFFLESQPAVTASAN